MDMAGECLRSTSTMRLRKPTKLGELSEPWLRHEVRWSECVAKTWRYFVSRMRCVVLPLALPLLPFVLDSLGWRRCSAESGRISMAVAIDWSVIVDVEVDVAMAAVTRSSVQERGYPQFLEEVGVSRRGSEELMTHGSGGWGWEGATQAATWP
jgi:hypothetical protein